jgi:hypothetical protein
MRSLKQISELEGLLKCYQSFASTHTSLIPELRRRKQKEAELAQEAQGYQERLVKRLAAEHKARSAFNQSVCEYLPKPLRKLLVDNPMGYQVLPNDSQHLFAGLCAGDWRPARTACSSSNLVIRPPDPGSKSDIEGKMGL